LEPRRRNPVLLRELDGSETDSEGGVEAATSIC